MNARILFAIGAALELLAAFHVGGPVALEPLGLVFVAAGLAL